MLAPLGAGSGRDANDIFALYRELGSAFLQREHLICEGDQFPGVALHPGLDHFDSLAGLQAI
jgi:hypothetical protein